MSAESSAQRQHLEEVLGHLTDKDRGVLDAARQQVYEFPTQGDSIGYEQSGLLPVGSTPTHAARDLIAKYGRDDRAASREPDRSQEPER